MTETADDDPTVAADSVAADPMDAGPVDAGPVDASPLDADVPQGQTVPSEDASQDGGTGDPSHETAPAPPQEGSRFERTGDDSVDAVLSELEGVDDTTPLPARLRVLVDAHDALQRRLAATDG